MPRRPWESRAAGSRRLLALRVTAPGPARRGRRRAARRSRAPGPPRALRARARAPRPVARAADLLPIHVFLQLPCALLERRPASGGRRTSDVEAAGRRSAEIPPTARAGARRPQVGHRPDIDRIVARRARRGQPVGGRGAPIAAQRLARTPPRPAPPANAEYCDLKPSSVSPVSSPLTYASTRSCSTARSRRANSSSTTLSSSSCSVFLLGRPPDQVSDERRVVGLSPLRQRTRHSSR